jgi:putative aminopeptidase FrvX
MGIADLRRDFLGLVKIPGPSGFEQPVAEVISKKIQSHVSTVQTDGMGNLLATREGPEGAPVLMLQTMQ